MPEEELDVQKTDEEEAQEYLDLFAEVNNTPSAEEDTPSASVAGAAEPVPDEKDPDDDGVEASSSKGTAVAESKDADPDDPYAWIAELPPEAQKRAKALQHKAVSNDGRLTALQNRLTDAEARLTAKQTVASKRRPDGGSSGEPSKTEEKPLSPKLQEFVESYPQLAESVQEMMRQERKDLEQKLDSHIQPIEEDMAYRKTKAARDRLEKGAADLFDTANTGVHYTEVINSDLYRDFMAAQPAEFQRIAGTTGDPDTALWVLTQFNAYAEDYAEANGLTDEAPTRSGGKANKTKERRQSSKQTAGTPRSRSAVTDDDDLTDYETYFRRLNS